MLTLKTLTGQSVDALIRVKVRAKNSKDWGAYSELNSVGGLIRDVPAIMPAPTVVTASVTTTSIPLTWSAPSGVNAGGTGVSIDSYDLETSTDGSTWTTLALALTQTTYSHTITSSGATHYYHIRATNAYGTHMGWSSSSTGIIGTSAPGTPAPPTVTQSGTMVSITWDEPTTNNAVITSYKVFILPHVGTFTENTLVCDGSLSTVISSRKCLIPMSSLTGSTYSYNIAKGTGIFA